jgi:hypothetical protein
MIMDDGCGMDFNGLKKAITPAGTADFRKIDVSRKNVNELVENWPIRKPGRYIQFETLGRYGIGIYGGFKIGSKITIETQKRGETKKYSAELNRVSKIIFE